MFDRRRIVDFDGKELREFRANPTSVLPVTLVVLICLVLPFLVLRIVPSATGQSIANDDMLRKAVEFASKHLDEFADTDRLKQAAEAFLFQQFLMLFLIAPLLGGVALAAHSVVGEKQGKTLEPLLTTPVGTSELLVAKVLAAFLPSLVIEVVGLILYLLALWLLRGAWRPPGGGKRRSIVLLGAIGPLATLAALQATIAVSSRANDPRSAQQIAVLLVLPLMIMLIGQIVGAFVVTTTTLLLMAVAMAVAWGLLVMLSVAMFDRENDPDPLAIDVYSNGSGPPLIVVPGIQGRWEWLRPALDALSRRAGLISYSLCGDFGASWRMDSALGFENYFRQLDDVFERARIDRAADMWQSLTVVSSRSVTPPPVRTAFRG